jgi:phosphoribosylglycinamide formyltransferase-1
MKNIIIFASGNGTNTQNIINYFRDSEVVISKIICNYSGAKVLDIARNENIESIIVSKDQLDNDGVLNLLRQLDPDLIVLAGFLLKIPKSITDKFNIVNLYPSLLPKFGGKGMWGMNVHKSAIESFEEESGITIH